VARRAVLHALDQHHGKIAHPDHAAGLLHFGGDVLRRIRLQRPIECREPAEAGPAEARVEQGERQQIMAFAPVGEDGRQEVQPQCDDCGDGWNLSIVAPLGNSRSRVVALA
jgi:hypothetical protein